MTSYLGPFIFLKCIFLNAFAQWISFFWLATFSLALSLTPIFNSLLQTKWSMQTSSSKNYFLQEESWILCSNSFQWIICEIFWKNHLDALLFYHLVYTWYIKIVKKIIIAKDLPSERPCCMIMLELSEPGSE